MVHKTSLYPKLSLILPQNSYAWQRLHSHDPAGRLTGRWRAAEDIYLSSFRQSGTFPVKFCDVTGMAALYTVIINHKKQASSRLTNKRIPPINKLRTFITQLLDKYIYISAQAKLHQENPDAYLYSYWC